MSQCDDWFSFEVFRGADSAFNDAQLRVKDVLTMVE
jgi:hypothetical protein